MNPRQRRPVNLDLRTIRMPVTAVASILHRVSGVALFVAIGGLLWLWHLSLSSPQGFDCARQWLDNPFGWLLSVAIVSAFAYHLLAGVRHLLMDCGLFEEVASGRRSASLAIALAVVLTLAAGVWLW